MLIVETDFYSLDEKRREWDNRHSSNKGKELLRDMMMEDYMKKKRMKKTERNDNEDFEDYENEYIEVTDESNSKVKYIILVLILLLSLYCYLHTSNSGNIQYDDATDYNNTTDRANKKVKKAKK